MSFLPLLILLLIAPALVGVALLIHSIRGKLVPGTTLCRACRFDLSGLKSAASCPECGASLANPRAIVPRRIRPRGLLWLGIVLTAIPLCIGGGAAVMVASKFNFDSIKPVWLLKAEALQGAPARSVAALTEIVKRIRADSISESQFTDLANTAVTLRRTPSAAWNRGWSDLLELARVHEKVTDGEWTDYVRYSIVPIDRHRNKMRQGAEAPFNLTIAGPQLGSSPNPLAAVRIRYGMIRATIGDREQFHNDHIGATTTISGSGTAGTGRQFKIDAPIGKARMQLTCRFEVLDPSSEKLLGSWENDFTDEVEIVSADAVLVEARGNPSLTPAIRQSLKRQPLVRDSGGSMPLMINAGRPPANLAFEVFARIRSGPNAGKLVSMGQISFVQGSDGGYGISSNSDELNVDSVDLIFRPSASAAEMNIDLDWFWTGPELVFEDVKIERKSP